MRLFVFALSLAGTFEIKVEARPPHKAQHMLSELKSDMTLSKNLHLCRICMAFGIQG